MIQMKLKKSKTWRQILIAIIVLIGLNSITQAQYQPTPNDTLKSITVHTDNRITLKIYAPLAEDVKIGGTDIPDNLRIVKMMKQENGVWEATIGPLEPGAYRYNFIVDKVSVIDPRNPITSESNTNTWSLFYLPGADFMELKNVPHGAVSEVTYFSKSLNRFRRMHIYTPPGYELDDNKYPVFYLLHGAFDCDDSWSSVGRAGIILDNLIAEKKVVPMVIVMPAGHTGPFMFGTPRDPSKPTADEFLLDFTTDIKPYVEEKYRVLTDRKNTAIAGLSMGGAQTLNIAIPNLADYGYFGVFSSGVFGIVKNNGMFGNETGPTWEEININMLKNEELKKELKLVWFATGKDDFLLETSRATVDMLKKYHFNVVFKETNGGHTWANWREYLYEFSQLLFK